MLLSYIGTYLRIQISPANRTGTMSNDKDSARNEATCDTRACSQHIIEPKMPCTFPVSASLKSKSSRHHQTKWKIESKTTKVCIANENVNRIDDDGDSTSVCVCV